MSGTQKWEHLQLSLADIRTGTNDFAKPIGTGGFGEVYEGELSINGRSVKVAVKRLNKMRGQGSKEFFTEISSLWDQQHDNIIGLVGYSNEGNEKILVYEYADHGSLDKYIRYTNTNYTLNWLERLKIVAGAARGLFHLHSHVRAHQTIIHRDIKSANILLDQNRVAKISDLGLSRSTVSGVGQSIVVSYVCGTPGYLEPEYHETDSVSKKADVYSFGVVLFEVLCGRLSYVDDKDGNSLRAEVDKAYNAKDELDRIIDPALRKQMSPESLRKFSAIAYKCLQSREQRPLMDVVKKELEETLQIQMHYEEMERLKSAFISCKDDITHELYDHDDNFWKKNLPNRYQRYIQRSDKPLHYTNKKEIYLRLCEGFLCDNGKMWLSLCMSSHKIRTMLPAAQILRNDINHERLESRSRYESRFPEVKILGSASSYIFTCTLQLQLVSPQNMYACYLVFKFTHHKQPDGTHLFTGEYGLDHHLLGNVLVHINVFSKDIPKIKIDESHYNVESWMEERKDGWMEVRLTKALDRLENHSILKIRLSLLVGSFEGIIVEGIEFRPYSNVNPQANMKINR